MPYTQKFIDEALDLYAQGKSLASVGKTMGCSNRTVMNWVRKAGIALRTRKGSLEERFWRNVSQGPGMACWLWTASTERAGYGHMRVGKTMKKCHRISWEIHHGKIPAGLYVLHRCDVPACVNPKHLWLGTLTDNNRDRETKGRGRQPKGSKSGRSKLTEAEVPLIRQRGLQENAMQIALDYPVTATAIRFILQRKVWRHV